jgi:ABC-type multidrug transport system fused ATPase/permease subunit
MCWYHRTAGQKGINLSGGQKSRTALARAVYADADIYILGEQVLSVLKIGQQQQLLGGVR